MPHPAKRRVGPISFRFSKARGRVEWIFVSGMAAGRNFGGVAGSRGEFARSGAGGSGISKV